jgi:2,3-bisphosphoglycerate-independent phosphoglycerate mutase
MLMILDGWGWREDSENNAIKLAKTPNFDRFWAHGPHTFLRTSGLDVGLPEGQMAIPRSATSISAPAAW